MGLRLGLGAAGRVAAWCLGLGDQATLGAVMGEQQTVAVAGATGFVGRFIVKELLSRGYAVRGLVRDRAKAAAVLPKDAKLTLVTGDVQDGASLAELSRGAWACVNAIGILREGHGQTFRKLHVDATRALVAACREAGVERFVQVSALGVTDDGKTKYQKTKFEGEGIVRRSGLAWTILRPSLVHGADGEFMTLAKGWVTGSKQPWFFLPYFTRGVLTSDVPLAAIRREPGSIQPVAVEDVAWAAAESLAKPDAAGEVINLVGPEVLTWPELLRAVRDAVPGANPDLEPLGIPAEAAAVQAVIATKMGIGGLLPFDAGMAVMGSSDSTASADKARAVLGFEGRGFRKAMTGYAGRI